MALLYDANGRPIRDGIAEADIIAAIQAAAIAEEWATAQEIADRHEMRGICLCCAIKSATTAHYDRDGIAWRVCITCYVKLDAARPRRIYMQGLMTRDVQ